MGAHPPRRARWTPIVGALAWATLIAATSSTVVLRREWFGWINAHLLRGNEASIRGFAWFWGAFWFVIVKGWHATEFAVLFLLVRAGLNHATGARSTRNLLLAMALAAGFAATDEWHQTFVPGRGGTVSDVAIDVGGILLAGLAVAVCRGWSQNENGPGMS